MQLFDLQPLWRAVGILRARAGGDHGRDDRRLCLGRQIYRIPSMLDLGCVTHWAPVNKALNRMGVNARLMEPLVLARTRVRRLDGVAGRRRSAQLGAVQVAFGQFFDAAAAAGLAARIAHSLAKSPYPTLDLGPSAQVVIQCRIVAASSRAAASSADVTASLALGHSPDIRPKGAPVRLLSGCHAAHAQTPPGIGTTIAWIVPQSVVPSASQKPRSSFHSQATDISFVPMPANLSL